MSDLDGYLEAFGIPVRHGGREYLAILDDDYSSSELNVATSAVQLVMKTADARAAGVSRGDALVVWSELEQGWLPYNARTPQERTDGFTAIPLLEP